MKLAEWLLLYVQHKDMLAKQLVEHKEKDGQLLFTFNDHTLHGYALDELFVPSIKEKTLIATLHTKANVQFLLDHWQEFSKHKELTLAFVHPGKNEKWIVKPHLHTSISESLDAGIWAMASGVSYV